MIEETIALISLLVMIIIFIAKILSVMGQGKFYGKEIVFLSFGVAWICWLLFFISLSAALVTNETITTPGAEVYTVENNAFAAYSLFLDLNNLLIAIISFFTFLEILLLFKELTEVKIRQPLRLRGR
jgi:hypothetical protein